MSSRPLLPHCSFLPLGRFQGPRKRRWYRHAGSWESQLISLSYLEGGKRRNRPATMLHSAQKSYHVLWYEEGWLYRFCSLNLWLHRLRLDSIDQGWGRRNLDCMISCSAKVWILWWKCLSFPLLFPSSSSLCLLPPHLPSFLPSLFSFLVEAVSLAPGHWRDSIYHPHKEAQLSESLELYISA